MALTLLKAGNMLDFSPTQISGLQLWLDASDATTVYQSNGGSLAAADGDPVGYWIDKSGTGRHASQASGTNKPALKVNIKNGRNIIRFDGVNDTLGNTTSGLQIGSNSFFMVFRLPTETTNNGIFCAYPATGNDFQVSPSLLFESGSTTQLISAYEILAAGQRSFTPAGSSNPLQNWSLLGSYARLAARDIYINGVNQGTQTATRVALTTSGYYMGCRVSAAAPTTAYGNIDVCEILSYAGDLSTNDYNSVSNYLNAKWAVY